MRDAAVAALKDARPRSIATSCSRRRYPWAVPAQHAAEAVAMLKDAGSVPVLVSLLKLPDPAGPLTINKSRHVLQDVVRLNHLNNCMMCHPPAATSNEPVLGIDPVVMLPFTMQTPTMVVGVQRTMGRSGGHGSAGPATTVTAVPGTRTVTIQLPLLIRGDITYLRQDFSVQQPVGVVRPIQGTNTAQRRASITSSARESCRAPSTPVWRRWLRADPVIPSATPCCLPCAS